jgi:hypothetical protein
MIGRRAQVKEMGRDGPFDRGDIVVDALRGVPGGERNRVGCGPEPFGSDQLAARRCACPQDLSWPPVASHDCYPVGQCLGDSGRGAAWAISRWVAG